MGCVMGASLSPADRLRRACASGLTHSLAQAWEMPVSAAAWVIGRVRPPFDEALSAFDIRAASRTKVEGCGRIGATHGGSA